MEEGRRWGPQPGRDPRFSGSEAAWASLGVCGRRWRQERNAKGARGPEHHSPKERRGLAELAGAAGDRTGPDSDRKARGEMFQLKGGFHT